MHSDDAATAHPITDAIEHAAHLLPAQGPIGVFIHHNSPHMLGELESDMS